MTKLHTTSSCPCSTPEERSQVSLSTTPPSEARTVTGWNENAVHEPVGSTSCHTRGG
jgi:hypothetical protein